MILVNQLNIKFEGIEDCSTVCESTCSLGRLYDYSCALQSFVLEKMKENEQKMAALKTSSEPVKE